jgi:hypothetical protein
MGYQQNRLSKGFMVINRESPGFGRGFLSLIQLYWIGDNSHAMQIYIVFFQL